jgi:hypothetical protein
LVRENSECYVVKDTNVRICAYVVASTKDKQDLLATLDPVARLEKVDALIAASI